MERTYQSAAALVGRAAGPLASHLGAFVTSLIDQEYSASVIRGSFPNDDAALKLLYLAIKNAGLRWPRAVAWTAAMGQFAIQFGARFPGSVS